jgi:hypothetical protein
VSSRSVPELIARLFAAALAAASLALLLVGALGADHTRAALSEGGPPCVVLMATGIECPFCGMTRATIAMGAGDFHGAFALHPLAPFVLAFAVALLGVVALGKTRILLRGHRPWLLLSTIMAIWVVRLAV